MFLTCRWLGHFSRFRTSVGPPNSFVYLTRSAPTMRISLLPCKYLDNCSRQRTTFRIVKSRPKIQPRNAVMDLVSFHWANRNIRAPDMTNSTTNFIPRRGGPLGVLPMDESQHSGSGHAKLAVVSKLSPQNFTRLEVSPSLSGFVPDLQVARSLFPISNVCRTT